MPHSTLKRHGSAGTRQTGVCAIVAVCVRRGSTTVLRARRTSTTATCAPIYHSVSQRTVGSANAPSGRPTSTRHTSNSLLVRLRSPPSRRCRSTSENCCFERERRRSAQAFGVKSLPPQRQRFGSIHRQWCPTFIRLSCTDDSPPMRFFESSLASRVIRPRGADP